MPKGVELSSNKRMTQLASEGLHYNREIFLEGDPLPADATANPVQRVRPPTRPALVVC